MIGVGFDIDHTLAIDNKLERVAFLQLLERVVERGGSVASLAEESDAIDTMLAEQRSGAYTIEEAVARFFTRRGAGTHAADAQDFKRSVLAMVDHFVVADPQAPEVLRRLQERGVRVAVLSNGWNPLQQRKARRAGFTGDVIASGDLGHQKPDRAVFERLVSDLGVDLSCAYYVGDDPKADISGALGAGLQAVWLDNEGKTYPADAPRPSLTISSLDDLLQVLPVPRPA